MKDHDDLYQKAYDIIEPLKNGEAEALITEGVVIECVYVLLKVYQVPHALIAENLGAVLSYAGLYQADYEHYLQALAIFAEHKVDIVDALLFTRARQDNYTIASFDKEIQKLIKRLS